MRYFIIILCLFPPSLCWYPRVVTPQGPIVGRTDYSRDGRRFYMFDGIPYAKPPTGQRRFMPPEPIEPWKEDFDASHAQIVCLQTAMTRRMGIEDCLILNVYTPKLVANGSPLSVIVFIHGGNFDFWTSARLIAGGPEFFMDEDIVLVTLNYRLGIFGFGSSGDHAAPGNYGLLDQLAALKWVQKNIASFGGNPDSVTIFGISAGGASVHLHMQSPLSKGLFHRAVSQSGTAFSGFCRGSLQKNGTVEVAKLLGCPTNSSVEMMDCLRQEDAEDIVSAVEKERELKKEAGKSFFELPHAWTPRIDPDAVEPFLPKSPMEVFPSGQYSQVPWIVGNTKDEFVFQSDLPMVEEEFKRLKTEWPLICRLFMEVTGVDTTSQLLNETCQKIEEKYLKTEDDVDMSQATTVMKYGGILHGIQFAIDVMAPHGQPIYSYTLDFYSEDQSVYNVFLPASTKTKGAIHANDFIYLFTFPMIRLDKKEEKISRNYISFLASFAKTGVPIFPEKGVDWVPIQPPDYQQLKLDYVSSMQKKDINEHYRFWDEILRKVWDFPKSKTKDEL